MNQRIQELWRECVLKHTRDPMNWQAVADEFAELIIRECIDIISPYAVRMENFDGGHPIADLKEHFGVES